MARKIGAGMVKMKEGEAAEPKTRKKKENGKKPSSKFQEAKEARLTTVAAQVEDLARDLKVN